MINYLWILYHGVRINLTSDFDVLAHQMARFEYHEQELNKRLGEE